MSNKFKGKKNKESVKMLAILLALVISISALYACGDDYTPIITDELTSIGGVEPSGDSVDNTTKDSGELEDTTNGQESSDRDTSNDGTTETSTTSRPPSTSTTMPSSSWTDDTTNPTTTKPPSTTTKPPSTTTIRSPQVTTKPNIIEETTTSPPKVNYDVDIKNPVPSGKAVSDLNGYLIDYSNMQDGYVMIKASTVANAVVQIYLDSKSGTLVGQYFINEKDKYFAFPLTKGANTYCVRVLEKQASGSYRQKNAITEYAAISPETKAYIQPNMYVDYNKNSSAVKLSCELSAGKTTVEAKVKVIYDYIIKNIDYDDDFAKKVAANGLVGYMDAERCLKNKKGICGDYAVLFATMCRAQGIPCMVVEGYVITGGEKVFHAWNKVYINGAWKFYDTTFDASGGKGKDYVDVYFY